ncbi:MAG: CdaR family protein [Symbiobacteriaceae bacterium]|nr:CdaR family protein [Symbiobacteriaceae bacterium]
MINRLLGNNNATRFLSLLAALVIWLIAYAEEAPRQVAAVNSGNSSIIYYHIPIEVMNCPPDMVATLSSSELDSVTLLGSTQVLSLVSSRDIRPYVNAAGLGEGEHLLDVLVEKPNYVMISARQPDQTRLTLEAYIEKELWVTTDYIGAPAPNYYLAGSPTIEPYSVTIRGLRSAVEAATRALAIVDLRGSPQSFSQEIKIQLLNALGEPLDSQNYGISPGSVKVYQNLEVRDTLGYIDPELVLPPTMELRGLQLLPPALQVFLLAEKQGEVEQLPLPPLDLTVWSGLEEEAQQPPWGLDQEDYLWRLLLGLEPPPEVGTRFTAMLKVPLHLPAGVRWANSPFNDIPVLEIILDIEWLGEEAEEGEEEKALNEEVEDEEGEGEGGG